MSENPVTSGAAARVAVLGPVAVRTPRGDLVEPTGQRAKALLVALALASPRAVSVERLTDEIWGDDPPRGARAALQTLVSRIRSTLGDDLIESQPSGYRLATGGPDGIRGHTADLDAPPHRGPSAAGTDLDQAERLLDEARAGRAAGDPARVLAATKSAVDLWRGDPGADLENPDLAAGLRERAGRILDAVETLRAAAALESGHAGDAEQLARALCRRSPFDDSAHLLLMRALDALGRSTEAVSVYAEFRERVQDAFGTSPDVELQQLNLDLLDRERAAPRVPARRSSDPDDPAAASASARHTARDESGTGTDTTIRTGTGHRTDTDIDTSPDTGTNAGARTITSTSTAAAPATPGIGTGIRAAPNALIGRETAIAGILRLVSTSRITTILGPGGLGKTRVAHEVARRALADFGAVIVVELASVRSADDVVFALASALGIREVGTSRRLGDQLVRADLRTRILTRLAATRTLLVLDNCEHLIDAAADWSVELTGELPDLTVLTTSRTPLAVSSERVFALAPLGLRATDAAATETRTTDDAVTLFLDRATAARPDAVLPAESVAALCARLDGLPLAIELAAARVRTMSIDEIGRRLSNRFALLSGGDRSAPERHRTLRAVIEWSWNLLGTAEQRALARLSEFADGFSADAAAAVVDHTPDTTSNRFSTVWWPSRS